jgi:hypothetical protein
MKKYFLIYIVLLSSFLLNISFANVQNQSLEDINITQLIQEVLNKLKQPNTGTVNQNSSNHQNQLNQSNQVPSSQVSNVNLPSGVKPIIPISGSVSNTTLKNILPDNSLSEDYLVQIKNLRITRIINNPNVDKLTVAIVFVVRENNYQCLYNGTSDNFIPDERPCISVITNRIKNNELAIQITKNTVFRVIENNKINLDKKINLNDLKTNDLINVHGYMDPKNYGIRASNLRKVLVSSTNQNIPPSPPKIDNTVKVEVISPNGDETLIFNTLVEIKWNNSNSNTSTVSLYLKSESSSTQYPIAKNILNRGIYIWQVGNLMNNVKIGSGKYRVVIVDDKTGKSDQSDKPFDILNFVETSDFKLLKPNGGEQLKLNLDIIDISWSLSQEQLKNITSTPSTVSLYLKSESSSTQYPIAKNILNRGIYIWQVGNLMNNVKIGSGKYRVVIVDDKTGKSDQSDKPFDILVIDPARIAIKIISPNGNEYWRTSSSQMIRFEAKNDKTISLYLKKYIPCLYDAFNPCESMLKMYTIANGIENTGSYNWTVGLVTDDSEEKIVERGQYVIVIFGNQSLKYDESDYSFYIY